MNVEFLSPLRVEKLSGELWQILENFCYSVDRQIGCVPTGYTTDFASVPRLPLVYLVAGDTTHKAPVIHDWLYSQQVDRQYADDVFLAAMEAEGIPWWKRRLMYLAVRLFGESRYAAKPAVG